MLTGERHKRILEALDKNGSISLGECCRMLGASVSTVRRDILYLSEQGLLTRVHGGAEVKSSDGFETGPDVKTGGDASGYTNAAAHAASLIGKGELIFIGAGEACERLTALVKSGGFVTNSLEGAKKLARRGLRVIVTPGEVNGVDGIVYGAECISYLKKYRFDKCFLCADGFSPNGEPAVSGFDEAAVNRAAFEASDKTYVFSGVPGALKSANVAFAPKNAVAVIDFDVSQGTET